MSAGAVRQGRVFVEIGADPKEFLSAVGQVNRQIANLGSSMAEVGIKLGAIGAAITAPIAAAAAQFGNLSEVVKDIQSYAGLGARDIGGLVKAAADLGIVLDKQTATAALQLAASTTKMRLSLIGVAVTVGSIVAPEFTGFAEAMSRVAKDASAFIRENRKIITVSLAVGGALTGIGVALTAIGGALKAFSSNTSFIVGPLVNMVKLTGVVAANVARLGMAFVAANPIVSLLGVALAAAAVVAFKAAGGFAGVSDKIGRAFVSIHEAAKATMPNMVEVVTLTIGGAYDAIAAGDFAGAVGILWDGAKAAWTVGSSAIMGVLDPWIESVQNAWGTLLTLMANQWDLTFANIATSKWGGYLLGAMDNVTNALMAYWDWLVGSIQKAWARVQSLFVPGVDVNGEIARIDRENQQRAKERAFFNPGMEGRTNLTDAEKAKIRADAEARIAERIAGNEQAQRDRRTRTEQRAADRPGAVRDAIADLRGRIKDVAANVPDKAPIVPQQIAGPAQVAGTFSAFAAGGMGMATKGIAEQQLDILKQIAFNTKEQAKVGP
jgi:hypothetical protein